MGPGFKYHVVTVVSIFFALTLGLVIGILYGSPKLTDRPTRAAIENLRRLVNEENASLREKLARWEAFGEQATPLAIRNRLLNIPVALVQIGDYPETVATARTTLESAGARITAVITVQAAFNDPDPKLNPLLAKLRQENSRVPTDRIGLARLLSALLAGEVARPEELLTLLSRENLLEAAPESRFPPGVRHVTLLVGNRDELTSRHEYVDKPLLAALKEKGFTVVAGELLEVKSSDLAIYRAQKFGVATIEGVDTNQGRFALVQALRAARENEGSRSFADRLLRPRTEKPR